VVWLSAKSSADRRVERFASEVMGTAYCCRVACLVDSGLLIAPKLVDLFIELN
jgi:hypothetical protein